MAGWWNRTPTRKLVCPHCGTPLFVYFLFRGRWQARLAANPYGHARNSGSDDAAGDTDELVTTAEHVEGD